MLTRFEPGGFFPPHGHPDGEEILVIQGSFTNEAYSAKTWLRYPPGDRYTAASPTGCVLYVKTYPLPQARFNCDAFAA
jgi:anti-sigma factor ChrR (cupin superfamily)